MSETTILHVSDTHLGKRQYKSDVRRDDFARAFDAVVDLAIERDVDAVVHTGDLFDSPRPNTRAISQAISTIRRLDNENIPFLAIVGNHERKLQEQWMDIFAEFDNVKRLSQSPTMVNNVAVYGIDAVRQPKWETKDFTLEPPEDDDSPTLLCMHHLFEELVPPREAEYELASVFDRLNFIPDGVALGDYHATTSDTLRGSQIFYAGSTERMSSSEGGPTARFLEFDSSGTLTPTVQKLDSVREDVPRPFYKKELELTQTTNQSDVIDLLMEIPSDDRNDAVVVVQLTGDSDSPVSPRDVYDAFNQTDVQVGHVHDKRTPDAFEIDTEEVSDPSNIDIESMIDEKLSEMSDTVQEVDENVRDLSIPKNELRDRVLDTLDGDSQ